MSSSHALTLTPFGNSSSFSTSPITSTIKSLSFFFMFVGIILIVVGYLQEEVRNKPNRVEYRYVPRTFEEEQASQPPILSVFGAMFSDRVPWQKYNSFVDTYQWQRQLINSRIVHPYSRIDGYGRSVGQRII